MSPQRLWPSAVATLLLLLPIPLAAAPTWSLSQGAGPAEDRSRTNAERAPKDAPSVWLHGDGPGHSRIVLETADRVYVREWQAAEIIDERTGREVKEALDAIAPPSRAVLIKVHPEVKFATLKSLMRACGPTDPVGYSIHLLVVARFPVRVLGPRR